MSRRRLDPVERRFKEAREAARKAGLIPPRPEPPEPPIWAHVGGCPVNAHVPEKKHKRHAGHHHGSGTLAMLGLVELWGIIHRH